MKVFYILVLLFLLTPVQAQTYLSLDSLQANYKTTNYTLDTKELYGFDKKIEIHNINVFPNSLFVVSILPNLEGKEHWVKAETKIDAKDIFTQKQFIKWFALKTVDKKELLYSKVIKTVQGEQYVAIASLLERFNIGEYPFPLISDYGTINIKEPKVSIKEMHKLYLEKYTNKDRRDVFPLDVREEDHFIDRGKNYLNHTYLSKELRINKEKAYQFWTFIPWGVIDGYNTQRGIDRFVYIPNKGIVGGSYDFYFELHPKNMYNNDVSLPVSREKLWNNIINERVMLAEELK